MKGLEMAKVKVIAALVLVALVLVVIFQNAQPVEVKFLFLAVTMPRAAFLAITLLVGVAVGILIALSLFGKKPKKEKRIS
jgi:uncharacterized integral membrane protein